MTVICQHGLPRKFSFPVHLQGKKYGTRLSRDIYSTRHYVPGRKNYISHYPQTDDKRDLVQSSFLQDFNSLFETKEISTKKILRMRFIQKKNCLNCLVKLSSEQRKEIKLPEEVNVDIDEINRAIEIDKKRIEEPFGESEFTGFISKDISDELKNKLNANFGRGVFRNAAWKTTLSVLINILLKTFSNSKLSTNRLKNWKRLNTAA